MTSPVTARQAALLRDPRDIGFSRRFAPDITYKLFWMA
jgi:hypothetical protein